MTAADLFDYARATQAPALSQPQRVALLAAMRAPLFRVPNGWRADRSGHRIHLDTVRALVAHGLLQRVMVGNRLAMRITAAGELLADGFRKRKRA